MKTFSQTLLAIALFVAPLHAQQDLTALVNRSGGRFQSHATAEAMHAEYFRVFREAPGFGMSRIFRLPAVAELAKDGAVFRGPHPDLIGLDGGKTVYHSPVAEISLADLTNKAHRARMMKREMTPEEARAVEELRRGKNLVTREVRASVSHGKKPAAPPEKLLVVGALRADATCAKCHGCKEGTLLGAFTYTLTPQMGADSAKFASVPPLQPRPR